MKEITRIHIAKTAYDIEVAAKKELEKYIAALERYAEDQEILDDIEIRITELLAERGVEKGGVIVADDVVAVRAQLGEPSDFAPEGVGDMAAGTERFHDEGKRVYRDTDSALVGGVLAGIARYFGIDPLWVRLLFLILLIPSFGTALIVYIILWAIIPPARTAAQKLQARGKPVTLESIKAFSEDEKVSEAAQTIRSILRNLGGVLLIVLGLGALVGTVAVVASVLFGVGFEGSRFVSSGVLASWWFTTAMTLFAFAGGLLATLLFLLANALFRRQWNEKTGKIIVGVIAAGLLLFATGVGTVWYGSWQERTKAYDSRQVSTVNLPANFSKVTTLIVGSDEHAGESVNVEYIVSDKLRYELEAPSDTKPQISIGDDSTSATISFVSAGTQEFWGGYIQPSLKIYGPALQAIDIKNGTMHYYNAATQDALAITGEASSLGIAGSYKTVSVISKDTANTMLRNAAIENLEVRLDGGYVAAGVVRTLSVRQPGACPAREDYDDQNRVAVQAVSSGTLTYNGVERAAAFVKNDCGVVIVGDEDSYDERED